MCSVTSRQRWWLLTREAILPNPRTFSKSENQESETLGVGTVREKTESSGLPRAHGRKCEETFR